LLNENGIVITLILAALLLSACSETNNLPRWQKLVHMVKQSASR
jgi:hypothetical protein